MRRHFAFSAASAIRSALVGSCGFGCCAVGSVAKASVTLLDRAQRTADAIRRCLHARRSCLTRAAPKQRQSAVAPAARRAFAGRRAASTFSLRE